MSVAQSAHCQEVFHGPPVPVSGGAGAAVPAVLVRPLRITPTSQQHRGFSGPLLPVREQSCEPIPGIQSRRDCSEQEQRMVESWRRRWRDIEGGSIYLQRLDDPTSYARIRTAATSRYHATGRRRLQRRVLRLWGDRPNPVCMLTLTFDPNGIDRQDAWEQCTREVSRFLDALWAWRKRHHKGMGPRPYLWVMEEQPGTGYPHIHLLVEDVWLAPKGWVRATWGHGRTKVEKAQSGVDSGRYVAKYVAKLSGWSDCALAYLARYRLRLFAVSQIWRMARAAKREPKWRLFGLYIPSRGLGIWADGGKKGRIEWLGLWLDDWHAWSGPGSTLEDYEKKVVESWSWWKDCA